MQQQLQSYTVTMQGGYEWQCYTFTVERALNVAAITHPGRTIARIVDNVTKLQVYPINEAAQADAGPYGFIE